MDASEAYTKGVERIKEEYEPRILRVMHAIKDSLIAAVFAVSDPEDLSCDDFRWSMIVSTGESELTDDDIDITFLIAESDHFEGTEEGINCMVDVVTCGGSVIGGMCPGNFTEDVWVPLDDPEAITRRFSYFEQASPASMVDLIQEHLED